MGEVFFPIEQIIRGPGSSRGQKKVGKEDNLLRAKCSADLLCQSGGREAADQRGGQFLVWLDHYSGDGDWPHRGPPE